MARIVIVEDEMALRRAIRRRLESAGHTALEAATVRAALAAIDDSDADLVITDLNLGEEHGLDLIHRLRSEGFGGGLIVVTAFGSVESAVSAMKEGADDYLQKPLSLEGLELLVDRTLDRLRMKNRLSLYERVERIEGADQALLGESEAWQKLMATADRMASAAVGAGVTTTLLWGETGAGKGVLARRLHNRSLSVTGPFVHVKCYALSGAVLERELFGQDRAPTAKAEIFRPGLFELARGGSIFLDEIGETPLPFQSRLLALIERESGASSGRGGVRLIASTSHDLAARAASGAFRPDLYYRLNVMSLRLPPLRERDGDALLMAEAFLGEVARELGRPTLHLGVAAGRAIAEHAWPGNVRELRNSIQRAALLTEQEEITPADLGLPEDSPTASVSSRARSTKATVSNAERVRFDFTNGSISAEELEKRLIIAALDHARGNISRAARLVNMTRGAFRYRVERHNLQDLVQEIQSA